MNVKYSSLSCADDSTGRSREVGATERTIKAHRHRATKKMNVRSLAQLVTIAQRLGLLA
ncbi:LuxR C-terminal-related transcriptional regulator [Bradyrhizobium sp. CSS354]|uniref:LuxR C-terminal-related transcriptional regulator n=1 Tax=Bradyrhizobium sp. CSS354 TaxID=2699172 RepID=UPI0034E059F5